MSWPSIDHTLLSPSGHVSRSARRAALKAEKKRLDREWAVYEARPKQPELSRIERLKQVAAGHPDNESVQAARRILARIGA